MKLIRTFILGMNAAVRATVRMALYAGARTYAVKWVGVSFVYKSFKVFPSCRNQSVDFRWKSVYWFLYSRNPGCKWKRWPTIKTFWLH